MFKLSSKVRGVIDCHAHMGPAAGEGSMLAILKGAGIEKMSLVSIQDPGKGAGLAQSLYMKARHPGRFFVFAGLNHAEELSGGRIKTPGLAEQAVRFMEMGCDGIKMIEGKPASRRKMNIPATSSYYSDYWARVEELGFPVLWHVNDPEEFWDPEKIPGWAKERDWGYGSGDIQKEELYTEVEEVLERHPRLKVVLPHFYFLSADLPRAARFLDRHPNACFDLAPGIEMLYNISRDSKAGREFFIKRADRILFGTDLASGLTVDQGRVRAGILFRWLESGGAFRVPENPDFLLGPPEDGIIRGMSLPDDVLARIYRGNFIRLAGPEPKPLLIEKAVAECETLANIAEAMSGIPASETEAGKAAARLASKSC